MPSARTISYQLLIVVGLLLLLEAAARIVYTVHLNVTKPADWFAYVPNLGWERRPGFQGRDDCNIDRAFDGQGLVASEAARLQQKPQGQFHVVFLGDSNTYGACVATGETFVGVANRLAPQAASINLGVNGYTSHQGYQALLKYGERIRPDLIFVSFNFNDRRLVLRPEEADSEAAFRRLYRSNLIGHLTQVSYLFGAARLVSNWLSPPNELSATARLGDGYNAKARLDKVHPRVDARAYRENLESIVQWAKQNGSAVAFILLGDNPKMTEALKDGVKFFGEKNYDMAIDYLMDSKDDSYDKWFSAIARLYLSKAYREKGQLDKAEEMLWMGDAIGGVTGGYPIVLDTEYQQIVKEVAAESGALVIDAVSELNKTPEVYFDMCHFDRRGHEIVGRLVAEVIAKAEAAKRDAGAGRR